jgi:6-phosphogluconolactonase (cycloisomerase 2 family)
VYSSAVIVPVNTTLRAVAYEAGWSDSPVSSATYTLLVSPPNFSLPSGTYTGSQNVNLFTTTPGASIRYTTDGSTPTSTVGILYTGAPVIVPANMILKAIAYEAGWIDSPIMSAVYTIAVLPPTMTPTGGRLGHAVPVTLSCATPGATIVYTLDGSFPAESGGVITHGTQYTAPFILPYGNTTVTAMAFRVGDLDSAMAFGIFTEPVFLYVGSTVFSSNVTALQVNLASGIPSFVGAYTVGAQVQTVAADPAGRYLFSSATLPATTNSFAINPSTGALVAVNDVPMGTNFVSAVVEATGQYLYSSTSIASGPTGYTINQSTGSVTQIATFASAGFTTGMAADPVGPYLYVALSNTGQVQGYHVNTATGQIDTIGTFTGAIGTSSVVVDPTGRFLYAGNPGSGSVSAFTINSGTGILTGNGSVAAGAVAAVAVDPSGRFLYVADSSLSAIYAFAINPATGTLGPVAGSPYPDAPGPVSLSVEPSGQFLYVAHTGSTFLTIFRVDSGTGVLSGIGNYNVGATQTSITSTGVAQ